MAVAFSSYPKVVVALDCKGVVDTATFLLEQIKWGNPVTLPRDNTDLWAYFMQCLQGCDIEECRVRWVKGHQSWLSGNAQQGLVSPRGTRTYPSRSRVLGIWWTTAPWYHWVRTMPRLPYGFCPQALALALSTVLVPSVPMWYLCWYLVVRVVLRFFVWHVIVASRLSWGWVEKGWRSDRLILCAGVVWVSHGRVAWLRSPPCLSLGPNSDARASVDVCRFLNRPFVTFLCSSTVLVHCAIFGSPSLISFSNLVTWPADNLLAQWPVSRHDRDECVRVKNPSNSWWIFYGFLLHVLSSTET